MNTIYEIYGVKKDREDSYFTSYNTREEAEAWITDKKSKPWAGHFKWSDYHDEFVIRDKQVDVAFQIPPRIDRDDYQLELVPIKNKPGTWDYTQVTIKKDGNILGSYQRHYSGFYNTFEPFQQNGHEYALISADYTRTSVMDLETGNIIAEEPKEWRFKPGENEKYPKGLQEEGFCPVGFYVPGWWDINDGSILPGSHYWDEDDEWPTGDFGFVWGCYWGDDSSWKVQYLDLSDITNGIIRRDERFGYVQLATNSKDPKKFIRVSKEGGTRRVEFAVEMHFDLDSGTVSKWSIDGINKGEEQHDN